MAKNSGPFIVVYGDEEFLQDRFVAGRRAAWKNRFVVMKDASEITEGGVVSLCETRSLFDDEDSPGRAVIIDNAQDLKADKVLAEYVEGRDVKDFSTILMAVVRGTKIPPIWGAAAKKGVTLSYLKLRPWETQKCVDRITEEAVRLELKLDSGIADLIHKYLGDNLRATVNELVKLTYIVGPDRFVKKEHVVRVIAPNTDVEPRHVAEAALSKNKVLAANRLSRIFKLLGDGACVPIVSSCLYQIEKILVAKQMLDRGDAVTTIAQRFGMNEFACKINLIPIAQKHTVKVLLGHMNQLCKLDAQVKGAARSKRTLVELAVLSIAA
jgi:DNA polymerase III delta subunit